MFLKLKNKINILVSVLVINIFSSPVAAYDIHDAINSALKNNQGIKAAKSELEATAISQDKAIADFLPQVYASANYTKITDAKSSPSSGKSLPTTNMPYIGKIVIQQEIFSGLSGIHKAKAAKSNTTSQKNKYQDSVGILIKNTIAAYQNLLLIKQKNNLTNEKIKLLQNTAEIVYVKNKVGSVKASEVAEVEAQLAKAEAEANNVEAELYNAEKMFTYLVGQKPEAKLIPIQHSSITIPNDLDLIKNKVLQQNYLILSNKAKVAQLQNMKNAALSSFSPKISAFASTTNSSTATGSKNGQPYYGGKTVGISITVPIFQQSLEYAEVRESKIQTQAQEFRLNDVVEDSLSKTSAAWHSYKSSLIAIKAHKKAIKARELVVATAKTEFAMGAKSIKDLLEAQTDLLQSKIDIIMQEIICIAWLVEIKYLMGELEDLKSKK